MKKNGFGGDDNITLLAKGVHLKGEIRVDGIEGAFDVTLRIARRLADSSLIARRIAPARVVVCGAPGYLARRGVPQTPEQLSSHACLVYAYRERWQFVGPGGERSIDVAGPLLANNGDALREAACAGGGLVQLPRFLVAAELASGALRVVLECFEDPSASIWVLYSPTPHLSGKVRAFVDFLAERLGPQGRRTSADPREHERARQRGERDGEEPGRSDPGERADILVEIVPAEDEDPGVGPVTAEATRQVDSRRAFHPDIQKDNGRRNPVHEVDRLIGIRGLADDPKPGVPCKTVPDSLPEHAVIVDQEDSD